MLKELLKKENKWKRLRRIKIYINSYKEPCEECFSSTLLPPIHKDAINQQDANFQSEKKYTLNKKRDFFFQQKNKIVNSGLFKLNEKKYD